MLKKTITYEDYDGNEVTEDFYFNLSKADLVKLELSETRFGGFSELLQRIVDSEDGNEIVKHFQQIILLAYGKRDPDNPKRFIKSDALSEEFSQTEAFSELFVELSTDAEAGANFVNGIVPKGMVSNTDGEGKSETVELPTAPPVLEASKEEKTPVSSEEDSRPAWIREGREPTSKELTSMSREELMDAMRRKNAS
jgi:hypothetical protein